MVLNIFSLDDGVDNVGNSVGSLNVGSDDGGLGTAGVGEGDGGTGWRGINSGGDDLAYDGFDGSGGDVGGLNLAGDDVSEEDLLECGNVGQKSLDGSFGELGESGVVGGEHGERASWKIK